MGKWEKCFQNDTKMIKSKVNRRVLTTKEIIMYLNSNNNLPFTFCKKLQFSRSRYFVLYFALWCISRILSKFLRKEFAFHENIYNFQENAIIWDYFYKMHVKDEKLWSVICTTFFYALSLKKDPYISCLSSVPLATERNAEHE